MLKRDTGNFLKDEDRMSFYNSHVYVTLHDAVLHAISDDMRSLSVSDNANSSSMTVVEEAEDDTSVTNSVNQLAVENGNVLFQRSNRF